MDCERMFRSCDKGAIGTFPMNQNCILIFAHSLSCDCYLIRTTYKQHAIISIYIDGIAQDCGNLNVLATELAQFAAKPYLDLTSNGIIPVLRYVIKVFIRLTCMRLVSRYNVMLSWASCQIRKIAGAHAPGIPGTLSPSPQVSDPDMHHGTCVTHVPWCMPGSLTSGFLWNWRRGKTFPAFPAHAQPAMLRIWQEAHCFRLFCCVSIFELNMQSLLEETISIFIAQPRSARHIAWHIIHTNFQFHWCLIQREVLLFRHIASPFAHNVKGLQMYV